MRQHVPAFADPVTAASLRRKFTTSSIPTTSRPRARRSRRSRCTSSSRRRPVDVAGFRMQPLEVPHGDMRVYGFRTGALGYITDAKLIPPAARAALAGVRVLVLNALWFGNPHPTHFNVEEAVAGAREIGASARTSRT
jgi:phosphoribosyl 1,2-cyclic phosphate phosphodiesterase